MTDILQKHPDLKDVLFYNPNTKVYKVLTDSGKIKEYWEKDENGHWTDQTEREKLREQIEAEKEKLERLKRAETKNIHKQEESTMNKFASAELKAEAIPVYAFAGNATLTLVSGNTNKRFTYKITKAKDKENLYFVNLLSGPDNDEDYQYIGCYYSDTEYFHPAKPWKDRSTVAWPPSLRAIRFFFNKLYNIPDNLHVYHEGRCGRCGRKLTTPESIERGLGPECCKR